MFQENSTAFPSATAVMKSSRWKYLFCVGCTHLGVWAQCMLGVWGAMQGAQGCPRLPPPPPTALSTRSALPYLVCFCILCCSYFSWGIFLAALQLQEVCIFLPSHIFDAYMKIGLFGCDRTWLDSYTCFYKIIRISFKSDIIPFIVKHQLNQTSK